VPREVIDTKGINVEQGDDVYARGGPVHFDDPDLLHAVEEAFGQPVSRGRAFVDFTTVIPFIPRLREGRIRNQESRFTHHADGKPTIPERFLRPITIPAQDKADIRRELIEQGIKHEFLFPREAP
jgi:hypothetical protein